MKTVLVVDDDESIRHFVAHALEKRNWTVLEAVDGVDGVARFMLHRPDTIITDISMPKSDGLEMLDVLRRGGFLQDVRVVIMSGVINLTEKSADKMGARALLSKPFTLAELYAAVGE